MSHAARRGHHRLVPALLAALTSTVVALLLLSTATPAQASEAPLAQVSSPSCRTSGSSSVIAVGLTNGTKLLSETDLQVCVLRHPTFTVKLHGRSLSNGPYQVTSHSTLTASFRRTKVTTQILPFAARSR